MRVVWIILPFLPTLRTQSDPTTVNPPHGCMNYGLCSRNPAAPQETGSYTCKSPGVCVCQPLYTGPNCGTELDPCDPFPCDNTVQFNCTATDLGAVCQCAPGWTGTDCAMLSSNPCVNDPCQNGGVCDSSDNTTYTCNCPAGYIDQDCTYKNVCLGVDCSGQGSCSVVQNYQNYLCTCNSGYYGRNCELWTYSYDSTIDSTLCLELDQSILSVKTVYEAFQDPSMTNTKCQALLTSSTNTPPWTMTSLINDTCYLSSKNNLPNVTKNNCDTSLKDDGCPGNDYSKGIKEHCGIANESVIVSINPPAGPATFGCTNTTLYTSDFCLTKTGGGSCVSVKPGGAYPNGFMCLCLSPTYSGNGTTACTKYNICAALPCGAEGTCTPAADQSSYTCACSPGYTGENCGVELMCPKTTCLYGGTCEDTASGPVCHCLNYYDNATNCANINVCQYADPCINGTCKNLGTGIEIYTECQCQPGYTGSLCGDERNFCTELDNPCEYGGNCTHFFGGYNCTCTFGTEGTNCEKIINYCDNTLKDANGNPVASQCNMKDSGAECISGTNETIGGVFCNCSKQWTDTYCDLNVIIKQVMETIYGRMDMTMLPILQGLLATPAQISDMVPFMIGTLPEENRTAMSWQFDDMFSSAAFEEKELDLEKDFYQWNDVVLGNCFTFNHFNNSRKYNVRSSEYEGGLRARLKLNQDEYAKWTDTAAILVFIHFQTDYIMSESIRYNAEPSSEVMFFPHRNEYTRLGNQYGTCIKDVSEVKAFYFPGSYTTDGCLRSCYQDMIQEECNCMDPRYPMPSNVDSCVVSNMTCIDEAVAAKGDPSGWPSCVCPLPCSNTDYEITWSKGGYRFVSPNCLGQTGQDLTNCQGSTSDTVTVIINKPQLIYNLFQEAPTMTLNDLIGNLGGLLGVLMGICAMTFVEIAVAIFRVVCSTLCKPKQA